MWLKKICPHYRSHGWILGGTVVLICLAAFIAPSLRQALHPVCVKALPPLYPDIFPTVIPMMTVGCLFVMIVLLTVRPSKGGYWIARTALLGVATIMSVSALFPVSGPMFFWLDDIAMRVSLMLYVLSLWFLVLSVHPRMPVEPSKILGYITQCIMISIVVFMFLDAGPYFVLFIWLYCGSYCRIQDARDVLVVDTAITPSIRYFSWVNMGIFCVVLLAIAVWGLLIETNYPSGIVLKQEQFLHQILIPALLVPIVVIGLSVFMIYLSRCRRMLGICMGLLIASIPAGFILLLHFLWVVLSWHERFPFEFTQWAQNPILFMEGYSHHNLSLLDVLAASVVLPLIGAVVGGACSLFHPSYRTRE